MILIRAACVYRYTHHGTLQCTTDEVYDLVRDFNMCIRDQDGTGEMEIQVLAVLTLSVTWQF